MRPLIWQIRVLALLQLLVVSPSMASGSVCIPKDATAKSEPGFCVCAIASVAMAEAAIRPAEEAACGPCRDEAFRSLKSSRFPAPGAPVPIFLFTSLCLANAPSNADAQAIWLGEPPGRRLRILRC